MPRALSPSPPGASSEPESPQTTLAVRGRNRPSDASGPKRKRADTSSELNPTNRRRTMDTVPDDDEEDEGGDEADVYDPDQPINERRDIQRGLRDLNRDLIENADDYMRPESTGIRDILTNSTWLHKRVRQTTEAAIDSRLLVTAADMSFRKAALLTNGNIADGVDVDEFVSKCIAYMRNGRPGHGDESTELTSTQRHHRTSRGRGHVVGSGDDSEDESGDMLNWAYIGRYACQPAIRRPGLSGFLLGPLSVEKKIRKITKRGAPFRMNNLTETRPQVLNTEELTGRENDLTVICSKILKYLTSAQREAQEKVVALLADDMSNQEQVKLMHRHGLRSTGGIDLLRFIVNPKSFGQTVENLFYVTFLIGDNKVKIEFDEDDLPSLAPIPKEEITSEKREEKNNAILKMDMETWRDIIDTLGITESIIPHRTESHNTGPGATGWYH